MLAHGEDIEADLVGQACFVDHIAQSLGGSDRPVRRVGRDVTEGIEAKLESGHVPDGRARQGRVA
jgi:hypothetical protein